MRRVLASVACVTLVAGMAFAEPAGPAPVVIVNQAADAIVNYLQLEEPLGKGATREMVLAALRQTVDQYQASGAFVAASPEQAQAEQILQTAGVKGGLIVHLGCGDGRLTAALGSGPGRLVHGLDGLPANVQKARETIRAAGVYGKVSADLLEGHLLPYADNTAALLVCESATAVARDEIMRVLRPGGVAYLKEDERWNVTTKPRPAGIDEWTHGEYDASGHTVSKDTLVGPPRRVQWIGEPKWTRQHEAMSSFNAMVSASGRVFYIVDEGPAGAVEAPPKWILGARDAFSGVTLWKRPIPRWLTHYWPWKSGPSTMPRRLVAAGDEVYAPLAIDQDIAALDGATGEILRTYRGTTSAEEMVLIDGVLIVALDPNPETPATVEERYLASRRANRRYDSGTGQIVHAHSKARRIVAFDAITAKEKWRVNSALLPMTLAAKDAKVVYHDGVDLVCLALASGERIWAAPTENNTKTYWYEVTPTLALYEDLVLYAWNGTVSVHSAVDGTKRWSGVFPKLDYASPASCYVVDGRLWALNITGKGGKSGLVGYNLRSGKEEIRFSRDGPFGLAHHRCHKTKATETYILAAAFGVEFIDPVKKTYTDHNWIRGACLYGIMPANGLLYVPPHSCACNVEEKFNGFSAFAPAGAAALPDTPDEHRLVRGPAFGTVPAGVQNRAEEPWPVYRHDIARSSAAATTLPRDLAVLWKTPLEGAGTPPVIAEGVLLVAQPDLFSVVCLDAESGKTRWTFTAGSRVDSPPAIDRGSAIFGSADGCVYCVRLSDGALAWKTRIAPRQRLIVARDRLESSWPVSGAVLVRDGVIFATAGRSSWLDGGIAFATLDAKTGQILSRRMLSGEVLKSPNKSPGSGYGAGLLQDILVGQGDAVLLRQAALSPNADPAPATEPHLYANGGFLDTAWHHRHYWTFGPYQPVYDYQSGFDRWHTFGNTMPSGRILAFDDTHVFGFGRDTFPGLNRHQFVTGEKYQLFRAAKLRAPTKRKVHDWLVTPPFHAFALLLANADTLAGKAGVIVMAGPKGNTLTSPEALAGKTPGQLLIAARDTGNSLSEIDLGDSVPIHDGMAAANGSLYIVTMQNELVRVGSRLESKTPDTPPLPAALPQGNKLP